MSSIVGIADHALVHGDSLDDLLRSSQSIFNCFFADLQIFSRGSSLLLSIASLSVHSSKGFYRTWFHTASCVADSKSVTSVSVGKLLLWNKPEALLQLFSIQGPHDSWALSVESPLKTPERKSSDLCIPSVLMTK